MPPFEEPGILYRCFFRSVGLDLASSRSGFRTAKDLTASRKVRPCIDPKFGLNLTATSCVILCDPWWHPAVEAQAIDRTHRIGQTQPVVAYRLVAADTVEQKILAMQREKSALANAVVQEETLASVLNLDSLRQILS